MPYKTNVRLTLTLTLRPDEHAAIAEDAFTAGQERPGTYAKALVLNRGDALEPIPDERTASASTGSKGSSNGCCRNSRPPRPSCGTRACPSSRLAGRRANRCRGVGPPRSGPLSRP